MGRKSLKEEIQVIKYMTDLSAPTFYYLKLCITSGDKEDKQWAVEQMMKLYPKALPNEITGEDGGAIVFMPIEVIDKYKLNAIPSSAETDSTGQPQV